MFSSRGLSKILVEPTKQHHLQLPQQPPVNLVGEGAAECCWKGMDPGSALPKALTQERDLFGWEKAAFGAYKAMVER